MRTWDAQRRRWIYDYDYQSLVVNETTEPIPVTGTMTVTGGLTNTELRSTDLPVKDEVEIELLTAILVELKIITNILNSGLNTKEDIDTLRTDEESDL